MEKINTYISILRGINVGGKNLIKMDILKNIYNELQFQNVTTYIQSGNVVFQSHITDTNELERLISESINQVLKSNIPVIVRSHSELKAVLEQNPFEVETLENPSSIYFTLLGDTPDGKALEKLSKIDYLPEKYIVVERTVYLYCPNGYGNTKLNNNFFEKKLKVKATTRNLNTMNELLRICESLK